MCIKKITGISLRMDEIYLGEWKEIESWDFSTEIIFFIFCLRLL